MYHMRKMTCWWKWIDTANSQNILNNDLFLFFPWIPYIYKKLPKWRSTEETTAKYLRKTKSILNYSKNEAH